MPSPFDAIDAAMQADIDRLFGEGINVRPQAGDQYAGIPDPARPAIEGVRATVARSAQAKRTDFSGTGRAGVPVATAPAEIWIDRAAYAALGYRIRRGDLIEMAEDIPVTKHTVAAVNDGDHGDVQIILG